MRYLFFLGITSVIGLSFITGVSALESTTCIQVVQNAENPVTHECQAFSTPCDVPKGWNPVDICKLPTKVTVEPKFQVQKFASCDAMEDKLVKILEQYQSRYWYDVGGSIKMLNGTVAIEDGALGKIAVTPSFSLSQSVGTSEGGNRADPFSSTNTQVAGVDESDVVKTDGINIYTFSQQSSEIRITRASDLTLQKRIKLPTTFGSVEMYLSGKKLIIVGQKYTQYGSYYASRWYNPELKSIVAVYNVANPSSPILERYNQIDGQYKESRLIGDTLYFLSMNDFRIPPMYPILYQKDKNGFSEMISAVKKDSILQYIAPQIRESILNTGTSKYTQTSRTAATSCNDMSFVLPDDVTLKNIEFNPAFLTLASINISDATAKIKSEVLFGDVSQIHMSTKSLYITSTISQSQDAINSACPVNAKCIAPSYQYTQSTLIHHYALENGGIRYISTTSVQGNPMNQYSMDEDENGNFRIVTQVYNWSNGKNENSTVLSIIGTQGKVIGKLDNLAPGENFQSARFIGNRLYLVTFQQIDPLFVIDLADVKSPKILGELKMPGYSTYLHPYDKDRLIGIGYDTTVNAHGGTQNGGIKIDLYNVADVKNPKQEGSLTLGDAGSNSDVLNNPRSFVWYKEKNLLLLPATLMKSAHDPVDSYRSQSAYQGLVGISILPQSISEKFRVTNISLDPKLEKIWRDECAGYTAKNTNKPVCRKLLDGSEYCDNSSSYQYIPPYCFEGSTVETYFASQMWNYSSDFVTRALYIGDTFYSIAENGIKSWNISDVKNPKANIIFSGSMNNNQIYPIKPLMVR